jgi:hypothetical protein
MTVPPPTYPPVLRSELRRATQLSHELSSLANHVPPSSPLSIWLSGRADEVRAVVGYATRHWDDGLCDETDAADMVSGYVHDLKRSLERQVRGHAAMPPPMRPMADTIVDL